LIALTAGDVEKVLSTSSVDLDVPLSDVMLVLAQRQIAVLFAVETNKRLAVTPPLLAKAQRHTASEHTHDRRTLFALSIYIEHLVFNISQALSVYSLGL